MLPEYKKKTNIGIGLGWGLQIAANFMFAQGGMMWIITGTGVCLIGLGFFIWGSCSYAQGKGYSGVWGLLGLFSVLGLIILAILPAKVKQAVPTS